MLFLNNILYIYLFFNFEYNIYQYHKYIILIKINYLFSIKMDDSNNNIIKERLNSIINKGNKTPENISNEKEVNFKNISPFPSQQEINKMNNQMNNIKLEFEKASSNTPSKDKFSTFIKQANDMFNNYEKQLEYYKKKLLMFNPNDLQMKLTNWEENKEENKNNKLKNENYFTINPSDKDIFFGVINKIKKNAEENIKDNKKLEESIDSIKKLYEKKLIHLYTENKNLENMIDKLTSTVINNLQEKIKQLGDSLNKETKEKNELKKKVNGIDMFVEQVSQLKIQLDEKDNEMIDLNKQQINNMAKIEELTSTIKQLKGDISLKNSLINEKEKIINTNEMEIIQLNSLINQKDNSIEELSNNIKEKEKEIKILFNDNIEWEEKYKVQNKEIENFKKWSLWDQNLIESFKKIDKLEEELKEKNDNLNKYIDENNHIKKVNSELKSLLESTKNNLESVKTENDNLMIVKIKYQENLYKIEGYDKMKSENEKLKKEIESLNLNYNKEIKEIKDKYENQITKDKNDYNLEIDKLKKLNENIEELTKKKIEEIQQKKIEELEKEINTKNENLEEQKNLVDKTLNENKQYIKEIEKKSEIIKNLNILYDNLLKKSKETELKLEKYETSKDKSALISNSMEISNIQNDNSQINNNNNNNNNKTYSTFDKYSFTKEVLIDYLFCLYLYEAGISIQNITNNIVNNLNSYLNFAFKDLTNKENSYNNHSNFPNSSMQNEFIEDIYFVAFDKMISKKIFINGEIPLLNGKLDTSIAKISFEDFDDGTIIEICYELINRNIITRLKNPKSLNQISSLFISKYDKKFDFDIKLEDFINKDIVPLVQKRIQKYDNGVFKDMRNLVELLIHGIKNGKLYIDGKEAYSFENYYEIYNQYSNITDRNIKVEISGNILKAEAIDNVAHTFKFYSPNFIRFNSCFNIPQIPSDIPKNNINENIDKLVYNLANMRINYTFQNFNLINSINKILSNVSLYQQNIKQISFNSNNLNQHLFSTKIMTVIKSLINLEYLDLSNNGLKDEDLKLLMEYLKENKNLKKFFLNKNSISSTGGFYIADTLSQNQILEEIYLSHNNLNDNGLNSLINILSNSNTSITKLDLSYNNLKQENIIAIADYLSNNPPLKYLDLSGNPIEAQSSNLFGIGLKKNKNLNVIKLNNCNLNEDSSPQILNFMSRTNMYKIELNDNQFGKMGPLIILNQLRATLTLKEISLQTCEVTPNLLSSIAQIIQDWKNLELIDLRNNSFSDDQLKEFINKLKENKIKILFSEDKLSSNANKIISELKNIKLD